jgi:regulator of sirC expression with transglutaminase-like and TPR domain
VLAADLALFRHVVARPEAELDLAQAALLIAQPAYPDLDPSRWIDELDRLAARARPFVSGGGDYEPLVRLVRFTHEREGFHGNSEDYYDPRNSYLNEVLARRTGIPISLAVVLLELARRLGLEAAGVSFPGHFLVRGPGPVYLDPFAGKRLDAAALAELHERATGTPGAPDPQYLTPATKPQILARMLHNLRGIFTRTGDAARLDDVEARLELLTHLAARPAAPPARN